MGDAIFRYDGAADALYYQLSHEPVARTVSVGDRVMVDVDAAGQAVGIEVLSPPGFSASSGPISPILPVPMDECPAPRRWALPLMDPCRGAVRVRCPADGPSERFNGDYGGDGWVPLGVTGYDIRCWADGSGGDDESGYAPMARVQYRPNASPRLPEYLATDGAT